MKKLIYFVVFTLALHTATAQSVALVMSGGAAKGIAHIGAIKALEEHNIPIDYVVGTSMGAVVGACYAAGFSAAEIEELFLAEEFQKWVTGEIRTEYNYYFNKDEDNPSWISLSFSLDSLRTPTINPSLANDLSINFVLAEKFARESLAAHYDFDSLFVPFRALASDVFMQQTVVLDSGSLGKAVRASMSVPYFYRPIKVNNKYLFDGGIYNNFPVNVANKDFNPDVVIGVNVADKAYEKYPYDHDDQLVSEAFLFMMIDKSDPTSIGENGVYIQPNLTGYSAFDFRKTQALIDSGYNATIKMMDQIKGKVGRTSSTSALETRRSTFRNKRKTLEVVDIQLKEFNSKQRRYIRRTFNYTEGEKLNLEELKKGYYKLVSEDYFSTVYPEIRYDEQKGGFVFMLHGRPSNDFSTEIGGFLASRNISHVYLGLKYYRFDKYFSKTNLKLFTGNFYKSASLTSRINLPFTRRVYVEPVLMYNNLDFINANELFLQGSDPTIYDVTNRTYGLNIGVPFGAEYRLVASGAFINNDNFYSNNEALISTDTLDDQKIKGYKIGLTMSNNTLNRPQYASEGKYFSLGANYFKAEEEYTPGSTSISQLSIDQNHYWYMANIHLEQYFKINKNYTFGYVAEGFASNTIEMTNYKGTIINMPAFSPLIDSKTIVQANLRAYSYAGIGLKNIFPIKKNLDARLEGYVFKPFNTITENNQQPITRGFDIDEVVYSANVGLVYHTPIGPLAANFNYYDIENNDYGFFLHFGYILFNRSILD